MPLFYVKIRKNIDICNYLPIYYPAICRGWGTFSVPSPGWWRWSAPLRPGWWQEPRRYLCRCRQGYRVGWLVSRNSQPIYKNQQRQPSRTRVASAGSYKGFSFLVNVATFRNNLSYCIRNTTMVTRTYIGAAQLPGEDYYWDRSNRD